MIVSLEFHDNGTADVVAKSPTGRITKATVNLTVGELSRFQSGTMIQDAMPRMNNDERELFLTGFGKEEWDTMFKDEEDT
jgi:hypothetical protein